MNDRNSKEDFTNGRKTSTEQHKLYVWLTFRRKEYFKGSYYEKKTIWVDRADV